MYRGESRRCIVWSVYIHCGGLFSYICPKVETLCSENYTDDEINNCTPLLNAGWVQYEGHFFHSSACLEKYKEKEKQRKKNISWWQSIKNFLF